MAKQNTTYNRGFHMSHDFDPLAYEREQRRARRETASEGDGAGGAGSTRRQRMDLEFGVRCLKCQNCMPRRRRIYANIRSIGRDATYNMTIHEYEFHCEHCNALLALRDEFVRRFETGGFECHRNCERLAGGFDAAQAQDAAAAAERAEARANETFEGEAKVQTHQMLEDEAARLQRLVDQQQSRDANRVHEAALRLVAAAEEQRRDADVIPVTLEDELRFRRLQRAHRRAHTQTLTVADLRAAMGLGDIKTLANDQDETVAATSTIDATTPHLPLPTSPPAAVAAATAAHTAPTRPKKRSVLEQLADDSD